MQATIPTYDARRAASLSGVPLRTLYHWAHEGLWVPSGSVVRFMRWSYTDLLAVRLIGWLRRQKIADEQTIPRSQMRHVRAMLASVDRLGEALNTGAVRVSVDANGTVILRVGEDEDALFTPTLGGFSQGLMLTSNLLDAFEGEGMHGPNLVEPRETLRIIPGKLSGEPHVVDTRIPTNIIRALDVSGYVAPQIRALYPSLSSTNVDEAIDLEVQLESNLRPRVAA